MKMINSFIALSIFLCSFAVAQNNDNTQLGEPVRAYLNLNNISTVFKNNGISDIDVNQAAAGFVFPKGSGKTAVYISGFLWGAYAGNDPQVRVGGSAYRTGLQGGKILSPGVAEDPDAGHVRIYRVRPDVYPGGPTVDLSVEAIDEGKSEAEIRAQYELDWVEWRAQDGAPFDDVDSNGIYDPNIDVPGVPGASQTIWFVANDLDAALTLNLYGSLPIGIEYQATYWAYNYNIFLDNVYFRKYKLINKSETPFNDMYITFFSDEDIGAAWNDFAGCDTTLNMAFAFNSVNYDVGYDPYPPPAVGFDLLKGPVLSGTDTLLMTAHFYFADGLNWNDPYNADQYYNFMQGKYGISGQPFINPLTGQPTSYALSGDPITGEGWIDGIEFTAGDRRSGFASGPFQMAVGDTQDIVIAEIAALGTDRLNSLQLLKFYDAQVQEVYNNGLNLSPAPKPPTPVLAADDTDWVIELDWGSDIASVDSIENFNQDGYAFQGYNLYQFSNEYPGINNAFRIATYDIIDGVTEILGWVMDPVTGLPVLGIQQHGSDSGIERSFSTHHDYILDENMKVGKKYYFAVTAYTYNSDPQANPNNSESLINIIEAVFYDSLPGANYGDSISVTHSGGDADGNVYVNVDDPTQLTGHDYEVSFHSQQQIRNENGDWVPASIIKRNFNPGDPDTLTGTTIDVAAVHGPNAGTTELRFHLDVVHHYYGWVDGVILTFPPNVTIISSPSFEAGGGTVVPEIIGQEIHYGVTDNSSTGNGIFHEGGEDWIVIVATITTPMEVDWIAFDDGYAGGGPPETGTTIVSEVGFASRLAKLWNLSDVTTGELALEDISIVNGIDLYPPRDGDPMIVPNPIVDGFQINVDISYDPPIEFSDLELYSPSGLTILTSSSNTETLDIQNYTIFGGVVTSKAIDNFGVGTNELSELQQDYELRFTGVYDGGTIINGQLVYQVVSGGQMATVFRMLSGSALANHPLNPNPGIAEPFLIKIPFEVWNVEDPQNPYQVNLTFRDRVRDGSEDPFWAWNPNNRMYAIYVNSPYDPAQVIQVDGGTDPFNDPATWVTVHYGTNYHLDDVVTIIYRGPIQFGIDEFTFTTPDPVVSVEDESIVTTYELFQNYPNPFNPTTKIRFNIPVEGIVKLEVYDILGQRVTQLLNTELTAGSHEVVFRGNNLASGVYFYMLNVKDKFFEVKKMLLLK